MSTSLRRRRERLKLLNASLEEGRSHEMQQAVRALLATPLITPGHPDYSLIRKHHEWLRHWFAHHAEWQLSVTPEAARLRKTPANPGDATRPCRTPKTHTPLSRRGYTYLCLAMASLIRADRQTTLGNVAMEIGAQLKADARLARAGIEYGNDSPGERRELVGVIRLLLDWGVLSRVSDDEERYLSDATADALYNVNRPILGRILAASQPPSLVTATDFEVRLAAIGEPVFDPSEEARNRRWRVCLFRRLLDDPVLYYDTLTEDERVYLDRQRHSILTAIEEATGLVREVRVEGIAMVDPTGKLTDYGLPEEGTEGHLTLLLAEFLSSRMKQTPGCQVELAELTEFTRQCILENEARWKKGLTQPGQDRILMEQIVTRLEALSLLRRVEDRVAPLPALGRYGLKPEPARAAAEPEPSLF